MQKYLLPIMMTGMLACTSAGSSQEAATDSLSSDSSMAMEITEESDADDMPDDYPDTERPELDAAYDTLIAITTRNAESMDVITVHISQYEGMADITWYFDKDAAPRYFTSTWAVEASEGVNEYFIENNKVVCARQDLSVDGNDGGTKWCVNTGGVSTGTNYDSGDPFIEPLPGNVAQNYNDQFKHELDMLLALIHDGEITDDDGGTYTVRVEHAFEDDESVIEFTEAVIPKKLYDALK